MKNLQERKLELEIQDLSKPWHKKIENWSVIVSLIVAGVTFLTVLGAYKSGILDTKAATLDLRKQLLERQIYDDIKQRDSIRNEYKHNIILNHRIVDSLLVLNQNLEIRQNNLTAAYKKDVSSKLNNLSLESQLHYYKRLCDSLVLLNSKVNSTKGVRYLTTEDGKFLTTDDGKILIAE